LSAPALAFPGLAPGVRVSRKESLTPGLRPGSVIQVRTSSPVSAHHAYQMYAHVTWHTYQRIGCVNQAAAKDVRLAAARAGRRTGIQVLKGAVLADHVHLLVSFRPDTRLSDFVRLTKTVSAYLANDRVPGAVRWARGYYAATLAKRDLAQVAAYIASQHKRHPDRIPAPSLKVY